MTKDKGKTILEFFVKLVTGNFSDFLKKYGFQYIKEKVEKYTCEIIYIKDNLYISFELNIHPQDSPAYFNILLGEGTLEWPDYDWNHVPLWRIVEQIDKNAKLSEYFIDELNLEKQVRKAKNDLKKYSKDFLKGDLKIFYLTIGNMSRKRKPYKIHSFKKQGVLIEDDELTMKLKKKYS